MGSIRRTVASYQDYGEIWDYVAENGSISAADKLLSEFDSALDLLATHPGAGQARPELLPRLRSFPVGNFLLFYRPARGGIELVRVLHGARELRRIFHEGRRT